MWKYILKRIAIAIPVLIGITIIDYGLMCLAGSPLDMLAGPRVSEGALEARAVAWGLDQPFYVQYFVWLQQVLTDNLGYSTSSYQAVSDMIASHLGPTLLLMATSLALSLAISLPLGIWSATHPYTKRDYALVSLSFVGTGIPSFFLALVLIWLFTIQLGWLPSSGMTTLGTGGGVLDVLRHMVMPVTVLTVYYTGVNLRYFRSSMLEISQQDYLRTARAKGIGERRVVWNHGLRNTLLTVITVVGTEVPMLFGGSVIVEQVFSWPGLGLMTMSAIASRDYPVIMGVCLMTAVVVVLVNLVTDILYALADPTVELK
ncbi:MAG: ABC transporter permease [Clostridiales bacterium]|nr:ABC transporter permease [Clostridiales bacterium]